MMEQREEKCLISIVIGVYNGRGWAGRAVDSCLKQTLGDFEILLMDDGPDEYNARLCDELAGLDPRIRAIHLQHGGIARARNIGIAESRGRYILFLDCDDRLTVNACELLYERLVKEKAQISIGNIDFVSESGESLHRSSALRTETFSGLEGLDHLQREKENWAYIVQCGRLIERKLFAGLHYPENKLREDEFMVHRLFYRAKRITVTEEVVYLYTKRSGSIMSRQTIDMLDSLEGACRRYAFYKKKGLNRQAGEMIPTFRTMYCYDRYNVRIRSLSDLKRAKKIDDMVLSVAKEHWGELTLKDKLRLLFPNTVYLLMRLRLFMRKRRAGRRR